MPASPSDPLSIISAMPPDFAASRVEGIVRERYGLAVGMRVLVSERDQNFHLTTDDGREFVFKIANASEDHDVTLFQIEALLHLEAEIRRQSLPLAVPAILPTLDGESHFFVEEKGARHLVRTISYLPGVPLSTVPLSGNLCHNLGVTAAWLGRGLVDFDHPGAEQNLLWDLKKTPDLRPLLRHIERKDTRERIEACLDDYVAVVEPQLDSLRTQVVHHDLHGDNVLVVKSEPENIAGVIDFGDMLRSPLVMDLGVAAAYLREEGDDPLSMIARFVAGYNGVTPLTPEEIALLPYLIRSRLAATISIHHWRSTARDPDDPYLQSSSEGDGVAERFLARLSEMPAAEFEGRLARACQRPSV